MAVELLDDRGTKRHEAIPLVGSIRCRNVDVNRSLAYRRNARILEADLESGTVEHDARVGLRCAADRREPGYLSVGVLPNLEVTERSRPESSK